MYSNNTNIGTKLQDILLQLESLDSYPSACIQFKNHTYQTKESRFDVQVCSQLYSKSPTVISGLKNPSTALEMKYERNCATVL